MMVNSLNKLANYLLKESILCFPFLFMLITANLFGQNEYSLVKFPLIGEIQTKNHQEIFKKDTTTKINFPKNINSFFYNTNQNIFICDNNGDIVLQFYNDILRNKNGDTLINGDILVKKNIKLKTILQENCIFIKDNYKLNNYYFYFNTFDNKLAYLTIQKIGNNYEILPFINYIDVNLVDCYSFTHHYNKLDYWLIIKSKDDNFVTILLDSNGLSQVKKETKFGSKYLKSFPIDTAISMFIGYMNYNLNISNNGEYIVLNSLYWGIDHSSASMYDLPLFFISKFDNKTGKILNPLEIYLEKYYKLETWNTLRNAPTLKNYVVKVSPLSNFVYLISSNEMFKFNLNCFEKKYIENSIERFVKLIPNKSNLITYADIQGANHKYYFNIINHNFNKIEQDIFIKNINGNTKSNSVPVLNNFYDDISKIDKNFYNYNQITYLYIYWNLTNSVVNSTFYQVQTEGIQNKCIGEEFKLDCEVLYPLADTLYQWRGPNNFNSKLKNPFKNGITKQDEGIYTVEISDSKNTTLYKGYIDLVINESPKYEIITTGKKILCDGDSIRLYCDTPYDRYLWSNGDTTRFTWVKDAGEVSLTAYVGYDCSECGTTKKITIEKVLPPQFNLIKDGEECGTAEITLKSDVEFPSTFKYLWNTGAITPELKVSNNGVYTLIVTDTNGCQTSKSIEIIFGKKPIAEIKAMGATTFCEGGKVELRATGGMSSNDLNFEWSTGEKVPNIWVDKSGIYKVIITHIFSNCRDSAEIEIKVNPYLVSKIEQLGSLCKGGEVELQAQPQGTEYKYLWSNGANTPSIKVSQAGKYTVEVSLDGTCKSIAEIEVLENQAQDFEIIADGKFCVGDVVKLSSDKDFAEYEWSNGETTKEINVTLSATYKLIVTDENGCTNEKSINVEFVSPREYKLDFTDYDFGDVEIGTEKRVKVNLPKDTSYEMGIKGDFPLDINTNEMVFKPDTEGDYSGEIVLNYGGECDTSVTINFKGKGINSVKYLAKVIAPKVTTEAGLDNVELPIKFEINDENIVYPFELDYKIKLSLNYDVYIPQIPSIINGTKREIEVVGKSNITKGENTLTAIIGKTYLSQNMENDIDIVSFEHKTDRLTVEQEDGYLNITGICVPELRGLIFFTPTKMSISPNPVSSDLTIKINTEEKGLHKLRLIDITGNSREVGDFEVKELTEKVIKLNAKDLAKGQYFLELITPNQTLVEKVMVE